MAFPTSSDADRPVRRKRGGVLLALLPLLLLALSACELAENVNAPRVIDDPYIVDNVTFRRAVFQVSQPGDPVDRFFDLNLKLEQEVTIDTSVSPPLVKLAIRYRRAPNSLINSDDSLARYWLDEFSFTTDFLPADNSQVTSQVGNNIEATLPWTFEFREWNRDKSIAFTSTDAGAQGSFSLRLNDFRGAPNNPVKTRIIEAQADFETTIGNQTVHVTGNFDIDYAATF